MRALSFALLVVMVGCQAPTVHEGDTDEVTEDTDTQEPVDELPSAPAVHVTPQTPRTTDTLIAALSAESVDPEGEVVTYEVSWTVDGIDAGIDGFEVPPSRTAAGEVWTVLVTPFAGNQQGPAGSATVTIENTPPDVDFVAIEPWSPTTLDDLRCVAGGSDIDGSPVSFTFAWDVDGTPAGVGEILGAEAFARGNVVTCTATPFDGEAEGEPSTASVTIRNTRPQLTSVVIDPPEPTRLDDLRCQAEGFDPDGIAFTVTYTWRVGGLPAGEGEVLPATSFARGHTVVCTATPRDDLETGTPVNASVVIGNIPPEISSVAISPSPARTKSTLSCDATGIDLDGDPVTFTYAWTVDGADTKTSARTLGASYFERGQTVACTATAFDGFVAGGSATAETVIENSPPTTPKIAIEPRAPSEDDDLQCVLSTASIDDDGDEITYTVSWTLDGEGYDDAKTTTLAGDTIPASVTALGQTWTCAVAATDGTADPTVATAKVTISDALDFVMFTTDKFVAGGKDTWLETRDDADAKCASEAERLKIPGSDWRIVYSNPDEDAADFLLYDPTRGDRVFDADGTEIGDGDLWDGGGVKLPDLKSWTITGTGKDGKYKECAGSYDPGTWPICQYCDRKFACAASTDNPFDPSACCWTGDRAIVCMGVQ